MYKYFFQFGQQINKIVLPYDLQLFFSSIENMRQDMIRNKLKEFTRDEWAYLLSFLSTENLWKVFLNTFGSRLSHNDSATYNCIYKPRGIVTIWLPNNVSMLGPLSYIMALLSGCQVVLKIGSSGENLSTPFYEYLIMKLNSHLREYIKTHTQIVTVSRDSPMLNDISYKSDVRVFFGSDDSWKNVSALKKKDSCVDIPFLDHVSEAWIEVSQVTDNLLKTFLKVFNIYGQAGCTSPKKLVLIGGSSSDAKIIRQNIISLWDQKTIPKNITPHIASQNLLAHQRALALGYDSLIADQNSAVFAVGDENKKYFSSYFFLPIFTGSLDWAINQLPANIQTIGLASPKDMELHMVGKLVNTNVKRVVGIDKMHHFGQFWDGYEYWRSFFECIEVNF